ncbi:carbonate dehydratase [Uliginosibacterium sp. H3]|uniref:Carbonic anhydrase n=1 Tax=Uliginosibacterium silvisoli TaxID=3114758 RepID=A0ABU6JYJ8_9RHOO|nr:carbonate dehydratase [Uliginosibacterium sp. H3]
MNNSPNSLLSNNRTWAKNAVERDPEFFSRLVAQQTPEYLWIGCSDSRVPANEITGLAPGEVFVHRNIANVVVHSDLNCLSVMQFAVDVLKVKHILVVGHYGCGGVRAALENLRFGLADNWIRHVQDVRDKFRTQLDKVDDDKARLDKLCEFNVIEQVLNVSETTVLRDAWSRGQEIAVHGWIYGVADGLLTDLRSSVSKETEALEAYLDAVNSLTARI